MFFPFQGGMFRFHVSFRGCTISSHGNPSWAWRDPPFPPTHRGQDRGFVAAARRSHHHSPCDGRRQGLTWESWPKPFRFEPRSLGVGTVLLVVITSCTVLFFVEGKQQEIPRHIHVSYHFTTSQQPTRLFGCVPPSPKRNHGEMNNWTGHSTLGMGLICFGVLDVVITRKDATKDLRIEEMIQDGDRDLARCPQLPKRIVGILRM